MTRTTTRPSNHTALLQIILSIAVLLCTATNLARSQVTNHPDSSKVWYSAGVKINQGKTYGTIGTVIKISNRLYNFTGTDLGGDEASAQTYILFRLLTVHRIHLFTLTGPNIEKIYRSRTDPNPINYLTAATGIVISYKASSTLHLWTTVCYLITDGDIRHWKYGAGITAPLNFDD